MTKAMGGHTDIQQVGVAQHGAVGSINRDPLAFVTGETNPDGIAIDLRCIERLAVAVERRHDDGR